MERGKIDFDEGNCFFGFSVDDFCVKFDKIQWFLLNYEKSSKLCDKFKQKYLNYTKKSQNYTFFPFNSSSKASL